MAARYEAVRNASTTSGTHDAVQSAELNVNVAPRIGLSQSENDGVAQCGIQSGGEYVSSSTSSRSSTKRGNDGVVRGSALCYTECVIAEAQFMRVVDEQQRAVEGRLALVALDFRAELLANELRAREKLNRSVRRVAALRDDDDALSNRTASKDNRIELLRRRAADLLRERVEEVNSEQQRIWHVAKKEVARLVAEMRTSRLDSLVSPGSN
jgi:hypothetical protein